MDRCIESLPLWRSIPKPVGDTHVTARRRLSTPCVASSRAWTVMVRVYHGGSGVSEGGPGAHRTRGVGPDPLAADSR